MTAECISIPFPDTCQCGNPMKQVDASIYRVARMGTKWEHEELPEKLWLHTPDLEVRCPPGTCGGRARPPLPPFDPYDSDYLYQIYGYA